MEKPTVKKPKQHPYAAATIPSMTDEEEIEYHVINQANRAEKHPYAPQVVFRIAYSDRAIFLHYRVKEDSIRAVVPHDNGRMWEDSCCEFFSRPADDGTYYNIECNCGGTIPVGCGKGREDRTLAPQTVLDQVDRWLPLGRRPFEELKGPYDWQMAFIIPLKTFFIHDAKSLSGKTIHANFHKYGDALKKPHFLSWDPINIEKPDFYRPDFSGGITSGQMSIWVVFILSFMISSLRKE